MCTRGNDKQMADTIRIVELVTERKGKVNGTVKGMVNRTVNGTVN